MAAEPTTNSDIAAPPAGDLASALTDAMRRQDRGEVRRLLALRRSDSERPLSAAAAAEASGVGGTAMSAVLTVDDFDCAVCGDLLYKPVINDCGHGFCFWW